MVNTDTTTPTSSTTTTTTSPNRQERSTINVGVDTLRNGLNPHLRADSSSLVDSIADLVLPSAFNRSQINKDLLDSAAIVAPHEGAAQTVRYAINNSAQWSDGTPISGQDFVYLWKSITSTPGVVGSAGYRDIKNIRVSGNGKFVEVDLDAPMPQWEGLFRYLLPSHLAQADGSDFATAFYNNLPAAGGRFMVASVDHSRGVIELHRNDRFWGAAPAKVDVLQLSAVTSVTQATDLMRSGQASYLDISPKETTADALKLVPGIKVNSQTASRELRLELNTTAPTLNTRDMRAQLTSLLDVSRIAKLAAGRSSNVDVSNWSEPTGVDADSLRAATKDHPLRIAADPADPAASAAARAVADMLSGSGVPATIVTSDLNDTARKGLPSNDVDAVISWSSRVNDPVAEASHYQCASTPNDTRDANLTGFCSPAGDKLVSDIITGAVPADQALDRLNRLRDDERLAVPLLGDRRVTAVGPGIVGPDNLSQASSWTQKGS